VHVASKISRDPPGRGGLCPVRSLVPRDDRYRCADLCSRHSVPDGDSGRPAPAPRLLGALATESAQALTTSIVALFVVLAVPATVSAQPIWLDEPIQQWNQPGMAIPTVPRDETEPGTDPRCMAGARSAETSMDAGVADAGWSLFNPYQAGWGITVVSGLSGHDGMCRPWSYHAFVFVDGAFAGTLAPVPSHARADGALTRESGIEANGRLGAVFIRYAPEDPLCCPSLPSVAVSYRVERTSDGPVVLVDTMTQIPRM
jgi:hypothetical protein